MPPPQPLGRSRLRLRIPWSRCRLLLLLHRLLFPRLLLLFLDRAAAELDRLQQDLLGADPCLVAGRLELASGWIRSDASIRAALVQASTACGEEKQAVLGAKAARDADLGEVANVRGRCEALESELKGLQDQLAEETRLRQDQEEA